MNVVYRLRLPRRDWPGPLGDVSFLTALHLYVGLVSDQSQHTAANFGCCAGKVTTMRILTPPARLSRSRGAVFSLRMFCPHLFYRKEANFSIGTGYGYTIMRFCSSWCTAEHVTRIFEVEGDSQLFVRGQPRQLTRGTESSSSSSANNRSTSRFCAIQGCDLVCAGVKSRGPEESTAV